MTTTADRDKTTGVCFVRDTHNLCRVTGNTRDELPSLVQTLLILLVRA